MARYIGAMCKLCRREAQKLFLKGERCYSSKCAITRRNSLPGQHGKGRKKQSEYGLQLREKQKARRFYGILESQFSKYFDMAERKQGITGENFLRLLESRLDNVVYRAGFAFSRKEARQLVRHGHFTVNGNKANIPSILLKCGDVVAVKPKSAENAKMKILLDKKRLVTVPQWISVDEMKATVLTLPNREDIDLEVSEHLIVELYSK
ncbi:MAG: 30S ribosomal protein S4 [Oscillospiraceae bacterium]|jgi:small subunit ribosomal protein S4|nr:30S ribosomal protein S4 [Oscillospiraceae bacterium]